MIQVKNYETGSKFVKVMPKILWPLFSGHGVFFAAFLGSETRRPMSQLVFLS